MRLCNVSRNMGAAPPVCAIGGPFDKHVIKMEFLFVQDSYNLSVSGYSGTGGESLITYHNGQPFTTFDRDQDNSANQNCATRYRGAWW